jgi:hypothetical protein
MIIRRWFIPLLTILCWWGQSLQCQSPEGVIVGSIQAATDSQGLGGVHVTIRNQEGRAVAGSFSGDSGKFQFLALAPDLYEMEFQKPGYSDYCIRLVHVQSGRTSAVALKMLTNRSEDQPVIVLDWQGIPQNPWGSAYGSVFDRWSLDHLPSPHNIWALLENQEPSSITNRVDEGGIDTGSLALIGVHGSSWTQSGYRFDGLNVTDPFETGRPLIYPDFGSLQEFQVSTAFHLSPMLSPAGSFSLTSRQGSTAFHGQAEGYYLGEPFQNSNLDDRLRSFGFTTDPHFQRFGEGQFALGGSVPHSQRWLFFTSFNLQHLSQVVPNFPKVPTTGVYSGLLRFDGRLRPQDQLAILITGQQVNNSNLGARPNIAPSATLRGYDRFEIVQGQWTHRRSPVTVWEIRFGFSHASPTDTFLPSLSEPNQTQLFTGEMRGAAPLESDSARSRFSLVAQGQSWRHFFGDRWNHLLNFGIDLEESKATEDRRIFHDIQLLFYPEDVPTEVVQYNTPSRTKYRLREYSLYFDDHLQMSTRLFLRFGLTLDGSNGFLPAQHTGAGTYVPARAIPGAGGVVSWTTLEPHVGLAIPILKRLGEGIRVSASFTRYYHMLPARYLTFANPNSLGGSVHSWNDSNHDGLYEPGEEGQLLRVFGGPYSSVDAHLQRPFTDEWGFGLDHLFLHQIQGSVRLFRRDDKRLVETVNTGVPSTAFKPVSFLDPGDDNIGGTADDQTLKVFNQDPATLGHDHMLLTNPSGFRSLYQGFEATIRKELTERWFLAVSFTAYKSVGPASPGNSEFENDTGVTGSLFDNPNTLLNARGRLFFDRAFVGKAAAYGRLPWGFQLGSVIKYYDGLPFGRRLIIAGFSQGPFYVMATPRGQPGGFRTQFNLTFDQRIQREWTLGRHRFSFLLDVFNLLNLNSSLREYDISGPLFPERRPLEIMNPRVFRFGVRWNF